MRFFAQKITHHELYPKYLYFILYECDLSIGKKKNAYNFLNASTLLGAFTVTGVMKNKKDNNMTCNWCKVCGCVIKKNTHLFFLITSFRLFMFSSFATIIISKITILSNIFSFSLPSSCVRKRPFLNLYRHFGKKKRN